MKNKIISGRVIGSLLLPAVVLASGSAFLTAIAANVTSTVIIGNSAPTVSSVVLNHGNSITLTSNSTTSYDINYTISDNNGCADISGALATSSAYRSGVAATCAVQSPTTSDLNCYVSVTHVTSTCASNSINVTDTVQIWYFGQATDSSSSFAAQGWEAYAIVADLTGATSTTSTSTPVELLTLTAINITTSSLNYGTLSASSTTGAVNQTATTTNAGNSSTTLQLSASATLTSGANSIATSSQRYSTSSFSFAGTSTALTASAVTVSGFFLLNPTSTTNVSKATFWGLEIPAGTATGTYAGTNVFSALFQP